MIKEMLCYGKTGVCLQTYLPVRAGAPDSESQSVQLFPDIITYGVIAGIISYIILNGIPVVIRKLSKGHIIPSEYKYSEKWVCNTRRKHNPAFHVRTWTTWYYRTY